MRSDRPHDADKLDGGPASPLIDRTTITSPQIAHSSRRYFFESPEAATATSTIAHRTAAIA
jgi:hypothetical protein